jgi:endonuclease/exonuclease/phosphatase family metal-dependent hydrolase
MMLNRINSGEFDIVAFQEVFDDHQRDQFATGYSGQEYNLVWGPTEAAGFLIFFGEESGLGIFVKGDSNVDFFTRWYRLLANHQVGTFNTCEDHDCKSKKGYSITKVPIGPNDSEFVWIVNTHLQASYDSPRQYENTRKAQLRMIINHLRAQRFRTHPVVLLGDLNIAANNREYFDRLGDLLAGWEDPVRAAFGRGLPFTNDKTRNAYNHFWDDDHLDNHARQSSHPRTRSRLDYILVRQGTDFQINVDGVAMEDVSPSTELCRNTFPLQDHAADGMNCYFSDHYGLSARMRLVRKR